MAMAMATAVIMTRKLRINNIMGEVSSEIVSGFVQTIRRITIVLACATMGWFSFANAVVNITSLGSPLTALSLDPKNSDALANQLDSILSNAETASTKIIDNAGLARESLKGNAVNPKALRQLAFVADAEGKTDRARTLMLLSTRTSRRDFGAQLWWIEYWVSSGDAQLALQHYDVALRANSESEPILFPILAKALDDKAIQDAFTPYVKSPTPWLQTFFGFSINSGTNPVALSQIVMKAGGMPTPLGFKDFASLLFQQLLATKKYNEARLYYSSLKDSDLGLATSTAFNRASTDRQFEPMTWQVFDSAAIGATFEGGSDKPQLLRLFASSGQRGIALRKLLFLTAGNYSFRQNLEFVNFNNEADIRWQIKCARNDTDSVIWQSKYRQSGLSPTEEVFIPADCPVQFLETLVAGGSDQNGAELIVRFIELTI